MNREVKKKVFENEIHNNNNRPSPSSSSYWKNSPETLLNFYLKEVKNAFHKQTADKCIEFAVRCLTLTKILYGYTNTTLLAVHHCMLAKIYWKLKNLSNQTCDHAKAALQYLTLLPTKGKLQLDASEQTEQNLQQLNVALESMLLIGQVQHTNGQYAESNRFFKRALILLRRNKSNLPNEKLAQYWLTEFNCEIIMNYLNLNKIEDAKQHLNRATATLDENNIDSTIKLISTIILFGDTTNKRQDKSSASQYYKKALELTKFIQNQRDIRTADLMVNIVRASTKEKQQQDFHKLRHCLQHAMTIYIEQLLDSTDVRIIDANNLLHKLNMENSDGGSQFMIAEREFCQNGGSCTNTGVDYTCICAENFYGKNCTNVIKQCNSSSECLNGGFCASIDSVKTMRRWYKCVQVNLTEAGKNEEQLRMKLEFYYCRIWKILTIEAMEVVVLLDFA
ncbi:conserved hypothetical protein [Trichinella spiralis]|uniref:hypothetical protein n=1 Tax=Trichinella spiralis TaxID=6334 RepID=UPI0001EFB681|nr:conserved hypothetical protein [Trichinella spiralis]